MVVRGDALHALTARTMTSGGLALEYLEVSKAERLLSQLGATQFDDVPLSSEYNPGFGATVIERGMVPRGRSEWAGLDGVLAPASIQ